MTDKNLAEIIEALRTVVPDLQYAPKHHWLGTKSFEFTDGCGCYSECKPEPCSLTIWVWSPSLPESELERLALVRMMNDILEAYGDTHHLEWYGCSGCGDQSFLYVDVRLYTTEGE